MRKKSFFLIVLLCITLMLNAQEIPSSLVSTAGDYFETESMSLSWSIGEVMTESFSTNDLFLTQGFQQSMDYATNIKLDKTNDFYISIYPNPASNYLFVKIPSSTSFIQNNSFLLSVIDVNGKTIMNQKINQQVSNINISDYLSGVYFIKIINPNSNFQQTTIVQKIK